MKLYRFEDIDHTLKLMPLAVRRALDVSGNKLSLDAWHTLPPETRVGLAACGSASVVDVEQVSGFLDQLASAPSKIAPIGDPSANEVPRAVSGALGASQPLNDATWAALDPLARYVLYKLASLGKAERLSLAYQEIVGQSGLSSHLSPEGGVRMVSVSAKPVTERCGRAESLVMLSQEAFAALTANRAPKGDVLAAARLAGIMAAKKTAELIPLCHPVALTHTEVAFEALEAKGELRILASVTALDRTGVEMEAMVAASVAGLTVYDMLKGLDRRITLGPTRLLEKSGGRSGDFKA